MHTSDACSHLPAILDLESFLTARAAELRRLGAELKEPKARNKRSFQLLPKWDRRRAQSHNPYRIPRRNRDGVLREYERGAPKGSRRRRRDTRRRTRKLLFLYHRRAAKNRWLEETHLWHAKRFHMRQFWGYRLAADACEKQKRRVYRFASRKAVIHDRSYIQVIEVSGTLDELRTLISKVTLDSTHDFFSHSLTTGGYRGTVFFFALPSYSLSTHANAVSPEPGASAPRLIGPVQFLWQASPDSDSADSRTVWLFCHPSIAPEIYVRLRHYTVHPTPSSCSENISNVPLSTVRIQKISNVSLFELAGHLSLATLSKVLHPASKSADGDAETWDSSVEHYADQNELDAEAQSTFSCNVWEALRIWSRENPQVPDGAVIPLNVKIPAVLGPFPSLPSHSESPTPKAHNRDVLERCMVRWPSVRLGQIGQDFFFKHKNRPFQILSRPTFRSRKRKDVSTLISRLKVLQGAYKQAEARATPGFQNSKAFASNPLLDNDDDSGVKRSPFHVAAGKRLWRTSDTSSCLTVPILVIRRCSTPFGNGSYNGYDIIIPSRAGAGRFWNLLTRSGCCAIGINDRRRLLMGCSVPSFPWDYPETTAGLQQLLTEAREAYALYQRRPPSKRVNYAAMGLPFPFCPDWRSVKQNFDLHRKLPTHILHNPLRAQCPHMNELCILRSAPGLSVWHTTLPVVHGADDDSPMVHRTHNTNEQQLTTVGDVICSLLLASSGSAASDLLDQLYTARKIPDVLMAVNVSASTRGVPETLSHLYPPDPKVLDLAINEGIKKRNAFCRIWSFDRTARHCQTRRPVLSGQVDKKFKLKHIKPASHEYFDELGQLGQNATGSQDLAGFVSSGGHIYPRGCGAGLGCVSLYYFLSSLVALRCVLEESYKAVLRCTVESNLRKVWDNLRADNTRLHFRYAGTLLAQVFVPFWFRRRDSMLKELCWLNLLQA